MKKENSLIINRKKLIKGISDLVSSAEAVNLEYVEYGCPGYTRIRKGKTFEYFNDGKKIINVKEIERLKKLVIPPAWENVWICSNPKGHLQATGIDKLGRKQYRYHANWSHVRNETKYYRMHEFGKKLKKLRQEIEKYLLLKENSREKILAAVVSIMEKTSIRIGSIQYEKLYGSFGLTTFRNRHVELNGSEIRFRFKGKKGIGHNINLRNIRLARIIKKCREIPGSTLFEYIDKDGTVNKIDSGMVNEFIHNISGENYSAKDFRTWTGSVQAIKILMEMEGHESETELKNNLNSMYELAAEHLGNTKAVTKKYYVHPKITELYEKKELSKYSNIQNSSNKKSPYTREERIFMKILGS